MSHLWFGVKSGGVKYKKVWSLWFYNSPFRFGGKAFPLSAPLHMRAEIQGVLDQKCAALGVSQVLRLSSQELTNAVRVHFRTSENIPDYLDRRIFCYLNYGPDHPLFQPPRRCDPVEEDECPDSAWELSLFANDYDYDYSYEKHFYENQMN